MLGWYIIPKQEWCFTFLLYCMQGKPRTIWSHLLIFFAYLNAYVYCLSILPLWSIFPCMFSGKGISSHWYQQLVTVVVFRHPHHICMSNYACDAMSWLMAFTLKGSGQIGIRVGSLPNNMRNGTLKMWLPLSQRDTDTILRTPIDVRATLMTPTFNGSEQQIPGCADCLYVNYPSFVHNQL